MSQTDSPLGTAPVGKLVLQLAIPAMLAQFVNILYSVVDRMYVGHIAGAGDAALAGVGVCAPVVTMITALGALIGFGGGPLMSIRMGRRDMDGARQIVANSFYLLLALSVMATVPLLVFRRQILFTFGCSEALWEYAEAYFTTYVSGTVFAVMSYGLNQITMSQGFSSTAMRSVMLGAAVNIALDPVFIFALNMGVRGAALATVLSQICSTAYILRFLLGGKAAVGIILDDWCRAIRKADSTHMLIADNIHSQVSLRGDYARPQDDYDLKNHVDEIGMSFYPKGVDGVFEPAERHQIFSGFADAARGEGFFISEMQTHIQAMFNPTTAVRPWELRQWCYEAYAAGAKALIYWMWRPFARGLQTLGRGLVDYKGEETVRFEAARQIGREFAALGPVTPVRGSVGVVYDPLCEDFQYLYTEAYHVDQKLYLRSVYGAYKALFDEGIPCDMIRFDEICRYKAVILTNQIVLTQEQAQTLRDYIENGGLCLADGRFALVSEEGRLLHALPGGFAADLCGQKLLDSDYEGLPFTLNERPVRGFYGRDLMELTDGVSLARFSDGTSAITEKRTGRGRLISLNSYFCYGYEQTGERMFAEVFTELLGENGIKSACQSSCIRTKLVRADGKEYLIAFNYADGPAQADFRWGTHPPYRAGPP